MKIKWIEFLYDYIFQKSIKLVKSGLNKTINKNGVYIRIRRDFYV